MILSGNKIYLEAYAGFLLVAGFFLLI